jgi:hypothetical protein
VVGAVLPDRRLAVLIVRAAQRGVEVDRGLFERVQLLGMLFAGDESRPAALDGAVDELVRDPGNPRNARHQLGEHRRPEQVRGRAEGEIHQHAEPVAERGRAE